MDVSCYHDPASSLGQSLSRRNNLQQLMLVQCDGLPEVSIFSMIFTWSEVCLLFMPEFELDTLHRLLS
jgi:hypothetical protein